MRTKRPKRSKPMEDFLWLAGGVYNLATFLGISAAAVSKWNFVPEAHVKKITERFKIPESAIPRRLPTPKEQTNGRNA